MRVRCPLFLAWLAVLLGVSWVAFAQAPVPPQRVVSLNPSLTAIALELGARAQLVGVDEYSVKQQPSLDGLPVVGGLFAPRLESIVALEPDLVVWVPSAQQRDLHQRLEALGIDVLVLQNHSLAELLAGIETLGVRLGHVRAAQARVAEIRAAFATAAASVPERPAPRTLLVLQRQPLFVVGSGSFLDSMLQAAGAENVAGQIDEAYPRVSLEWLIAARPEVILDASETPEPAADFWARWPSLPAVSEGRVVAIPAAEVTLPGPHLERGLAILRAALFAEPMTRSSETRG